MQEKSEGGKLGLAQSGCTRAGRQWQIACVLTNHPPAKKSMSCSAMTNSGPTALTFNSPRLNHNQCQHSIKDATTHAAQLSHCVSERKTRMRVQMREQQRQLGSSDPVDGKCFICTSDPHQCMWDMCHLQLYMSFRLAGTCTMYCCTCFWGCCGSVPSTAIHGSEGR